MSRKLPLIVIVFWILLAGCSHQADPTATISVEQIETHAIQTMQAGYTQTTVPTVADTIVPEITPTPTASLAVSPTITNTIVFIPTNNTTGGTGITTTSDSASYVSDVTIPDHTEMYAGQEFTKTWELQNSGVTAWTSSYYLAFVSGDIMDGENTVIGETVAVGSNIEISIDMVAPTTSGEYTGYWQMVNDNGTTFGDMIYVIITVTDDSTPTVTSTLTSTGTGSTSTITPTQTTTSIASTQTATFPQTATTTETPTSTSTATFTATITLTPTEE